ncbi:MAG TPA: DUF1080 domain-containing protein [Pirellulales bacterium]|nr:DUF1080 domain-containing protein [Pirellulales bacterium]
MICSLRRAILASVFVSAACFATTAIAAAPNTLTPEELDDGWILLFDGETTFGWHAEKKADWKVADGAITVSSGEPGLLATTSEFADYELKLEFRAPRGTNSGVFLRTPAVPTDPAKDCYELNIADPDTSPFYTGSFVGRQKATEYLHSDDWQSFEVTARGGHFVVKVDGRQVLDYTDPAPLGRGRIGLQLNKGPVAFRNIKLRPLGLESIFNGRDLTGWKVFPDKKSVFTVTPEGDLNVKNGNGQIETEGQWADFVLQLDIFSNGKFLNSGIFFRTIPGGFWQGYESQIQNGFLLDRARPMDYGTGGIYNRQKARKVVPDDFVWFHKTLVVSGDHMAAWVNGYQVSDFTDTRPPNENARDGLRLKAGTLAIQGHDRTTDLSFRKIRIAEMPAR